MNLIPAWALRRIAIENPDELDVYLESDPAVGSIAGGNVAIIHKSVTTRPKLDLRHSHNILVIHRGAAIQGTMQCLGKVGTITISENVQCKKTGITTMIHQSSVFVGANTYIGGASLMAMEGQSITIGEGCLFSSGIGIRTSDSHALKDATTGERINPAGPVRVCDRVWLGREVVIQKGVTVGEGSVLAQRSTVTRDVDPNCVYGGTPARKIRSNIVWDRSLKER